MPRMKGGQRVDAREVGVYARVAPAPGGEAGRPDERGFTLIEMLIAVAILGAVVTAMMTALAGVTMASSQERSLSVAQSEARRLAENVRTLSYSRCAPPTAYDAAKDAAFAGTESIDSIQV